MKYILTILTFLFVKGFMFKSAVFFGASFGIANTVYSQTPVQTSNTASKTWFVYPSISGRAATDSPRLLEIHDSTDMRIKMSRVYFDSLLISNTNSATMLMIDGAGRMWNNNMSAVITPQSNVSHLSDSMGLYMKIQVAADSIVNMKVLIDTKQNAITTGSTAQYVRGDLSLASFPSIPSAQTNTDWNSSSGVSQLLNKPDISLYLLSSTAASTYQTALGFTPYNSTNPSGYISSVPAQTFASLTSKPTTLSGYGITDAYPLSGNPSAFLTSVPAQSWVSITGKPTFASVATSGLYSDLTGAPDLSVYATAGNTMTFTGKTWNGVAIGDTYISSASTWNAKQAALSGTGFVKISGSTISYDNSTYLTGNQTITLSGDATGSGTTAITTTLATVNSNVGTFNGSYTANAKGLITAATNASFNSAPARALSTTGSNNTYTISATKNARVHYTVNFAFALTLTTSNGYVQLDYSTDGGSNWITCGSVSSVYSLSVTLTGNTDSELVGEIPANALVRLYRINATNVTITAPTTKQLEVTY